jgi:hypothetical protein
MVTDPAEQENRRIITGSRKGRRRRKGGISAEILGR